jgi:hypothetical protein
VVPRERSDRWPRQLQRPSYTAFALPFLVSASQMVDYLNHSVLALRLANSTQH